MKMNIDNKYINELVDFFYHGNRDEYLYDDLYNYLHSLENKVIIEIENNILLLDNPFATLNYIANSIEKLEFNLVDFMTCEEIDSLDCYYDEYTNGIVGISFEDLECESRDETQMVKDFRGIYKRSKVYESIIKITKSLYEIKNRFKNEENIGFEFETSQDFEINLQLTKLNKVILRHVNEKYPYNVIKYIKNTAPIWCFFMLKNLKHKAEEVFKNITDDNKKNPQVNNLMKAFAKEIEKMKVLKYVDINKLYSNDNYLKSGIKDLLEKESVIAAAKETNNPDLMILTMTKTDFDLFFKDNHNESDIAKYDKKREEYINLYKFEVIDFYYNKIKTLMAEYVGSNDKNDEIFVAEKNIVESLSHLKDTEYSKYFIKNGYEIFQKCYTKYENEVNTTAYFSAIYRIMNSELLLVEHLGNIGFMNFLRKYSNRKIDLNQIKTKGSISKDTYGMVLKEIKD